MSNLPAYATFTVGGLGLAGVIITVANGRHQWKREWRARSLDNYIEMVILADSMSGLIVDFSREMLAVSSGKAVDQSNLLQMKTALEGHLAQRDAILTHSTKVQILATGKLERAGSRLVDFLRARAEELPIEDIEKYRAEYREVRKDFLHAGRRHFRLPRR